MYKSKSVEEDGWHLYEYHPYNFFSILCAGAIYPGLRKGGKSSVDKWTEHSGVFLGWFVFRDLFFGGFCFVFVGGVVCGGFFLFCF